MDKKQIIAVAALAVGFLAWRIGAMQSEGSASQAGQEEKILFITSDGERISVPSKDALRFGTVNDLIETASESGEIRLKVSGAVLKRLLIDMGVMQGTYEKRILNQIENLEASIYLSSAELIDKYAKEVAVGLASDEFLKFLQEQDPAYLAAIKNLSMGAKIKIYSHLPSEFWGYLGKIDHDDEVKTVRFSADSRKIMTVTDTVVTMGMLDMNNNHLSLFVHSTEEPIQSAALSTDSSLTMVIADDKADLIWFGDSGWLHGSMSGETKVGAFSPDGKKFFQCDDAGDVVLYEKNTNTDWNGSRMGNENGVKFAVFSPDNMNVYVIKEDGSYLLWHTNGANIEARIGFPTSIGAESAKFSPDSQRVLASSLKRAAIFYDDANRGWIQGIMHTDDDIVLAEWSPDSKKVALRHANTVDIMWEDAQGYDIQYSIEHTARINAAIFSPDSKKIATASEDKTAKIDLNVNDPAGAAHTITHGGPVYSVAFSPDSKRVVTASGDNTAKIVWQDENNQWQEHIVDHTGPVRGAVFSADGKRVVTASDDGTAKVVWQDEKGVWQEYIIGYNAAIKSAIFSPDSKNILIVSNNTVMLMTLIQANTFDQALFLKLSHWTKDRELSIKLEGWAQEVLETFEAGDKGILERNFDKVFTR